MNNKTKGDLLENVIEQLCTGVENSKVTKKAKTKDLYISLLFKYNLAYAKSLNPDKIFILSALQGLVDLEDELEPYELTLNTMKSGEIKAWSDKVIGQMKKVIGLDNDEIIFLAGSKYRKYLLPNIKNARMPLQGMSIGKQLQFLKNKTSQ
jgi:hypothetical protein